MGLGTRGEIWTNPPFALSSPATSALIKRVAEECDVSILAVQVEAE